MIEEYLKETKKIDINFEHFHKWSKLSSLEASSIWMKNLREITRQKNLAMIYGAWREKINF